MFQNDDGLTTATPYKNCTPAHALNFYLAGILPQTAYHAHSELDTGGPAKVGATVLSRALASIRPACRDDIVIGLDAPDDAAMVDTGGENLSLQTVDYFRSFVDDPYVFGKIAANHALGDIYAMGGEPQSALAQGILFGSRSATAFS